MDRIARFFAVFYSFLRCSMGDLPNMKHELFCRNYAVFATASRAARVAGYSNKTAKWQGLRLLKRADIQARLAERRAEIAKEYSLDAAVLLCKLEAVFLQASDQGDHKAAARVVEAQARVAGILKGRTTSIPPLLALFGGADGAAEHLVALAEAVKSAAVRQSANENVQKGDKG
jgi:hypothetical protein